MNCANLKFAEKLCLKLVIQILRICKYRSAEVVDCLPVVTEKETMNIVPIVHIDTAVDIQIQTLIILIVCHLSATLMAVKVTIVHHHQILRKVDLSIETSVQRMTLSTTMVQKQVHHTTTKNQDVSFFELGNGIQC